MEKRLSRESIAPRQMCILRRINSWSDPHMQRETSIIAFMPTTHVPNLVEKTTHFTFRLTHGIKDQISIG